MWRTHTHTEIGTAGCSVCVRPNVRPRPLCSCFVLRPHTSLVNKNVMWLCFINLALHFSQIQPTCSLHDHSQGSLIFLLNVQEKAKFRAGDLCQERNIYPRWRKRCPATELLLAIFGGYSLHSSKITWKIPHGPPWTWDLWRNPLSRFPDADTVNEDRKKFQFFHISNFWACVQGFYYC